MSAPKDANDEPTFEIQALKCIFIRVSDQAFGMDVIAEASLRASLPEAALGISFAQDSTDFIDWIRYSCQPKPLS